MSSSINSLAQTFGEISNKYFKAYGVQGSVAFSEETGDRMAWTKIEQLINEK
jgi:hypothetical protein